MQAELLDASVEQPIVFAGGVDVVGGGCGRVQVAADLVAFGGGQAGGIGGSGAGRGQAGEQGSPAHAGIDRRLSGSGIHG